MCKKGFPCKFSSTYGSVFLLMVPLVMVSVFFATFGSKTSSGGGDWPSFISGHYPNWLWGGSSYGDNYYSLNDSAVAMPADGGGDDGGNIVVMGVSGGGGGGISINNNSTEEERAYDMLFVVNRSPSPLEDMHVVQETLVLKNTTKEEDDALVSSSETSAAEPPLDDKSRGTTEYTNLERLEFDLQKARTAIREAKSGNQTHDSDYVPVGPMYWNS